MAAFLSALDGVLPPLCGVEEPLVDGPPVGTRIWLHSLSSHVVQLNWQQVGPQQLEAAQCADESFSMHLLIETMLSIATAQSSGDFSQTAMSMTHSSMQQTGPLCMKA